MDFVTDKMNPLIGNKKTQPNRSALEEVLDMLIDLSGVVREMNKELLDIRIKLVELEQQIKLDKLLRGE